MDSKFLKFIYEYRCFIVFYLIWLFLHFMFYLLSDDPEFYPHSAFKLKRSGFWPFNPKSDISGYNSTELFVYLSLPLIIFAIWKLVGKDIKKIIDSLKD